VYELKLEAASEQALNESRPEKAR
jgi:K+-sensing histidine kinase KdpD